MLASRSRRMIRMMFLSLTTTALLASGYVSSYYGTWWLLGRRAMTINSHLQLQQTVYRPMTWFIVSGRAGSETANKLTLWLHSLGSKTHQSWDTIDGRIGTPQSMPSPQPAGTAGTTS